MNWKRDLKKLFETECKEPKIDEKYEREAKMHKG